MKPTPTRVANASTARLRPRRRSVRPVVAAAAALGALLLAGCGGQNAVKPPAPQGQAGAPGAAAPGAPAPAGDGAAAPADASQNGTGGGAAKAAPALARSEPQKIAIPSLGLTSTLETLRQNADGTMQTPKDPALAGWYEPGPTPGSQGPAVIAGHVTWNGASAVFEKLKTMKGGDTIKVTRKDGKTVTFKVDRVAEYPKAEFPTLEVYKNLDHAGLRLVTCGGDFDPKKHYYDSNVVVFARMTDAA
ncbi:class F sortase [Streptomyces erythrochromogenes]|uniref:class F sortase n=1 Tax=Streptomyces erythrochromogenes TaxID=285574 RepID=UPI003416E474